MEKTEIKQMPKSPGVLSMFFKKLFRNKLAVIGFVIVLLMVFTAVFANLISPYNPNEIDIANSLLKPGVNGHILGTDSFGRDLFSRIIHGSSVSIMVGLGAVGVGGIIGVLLGLVAGFFGGIIDSIIMRIMDALFAFPFILLAITLMMVLGPGLLNAIVAIGIGNIPGFARMTRGQVLSVKEEDYIEVTQSLGAGKMENFIQTHFAELYNSRYSLRNYERCRSYNIGSRFVISRTRYSSASCILGEYTS